MVSKTNHWPPSERSCFGNCSSYKLISNITILLSLIKLKMASLLFCTAFLLLCLPRIHCSNENLYETTRIRRAFIKRSKKKIFWTRDANLQPFGSHDLLTRISPQYNIELSQSGPQGVRDCHQHTEATLHMAISFTLYKLGSFISASDTEEVSALF